MFKDIINFKCLVILSFLFLSFFLGRGSLIEQAISPSLKKLTIMNKIFQMKIIGLKLIKNESRALIFLILSQDSKLQLSIFAQQSQSYLFIILLQFFIFLCQSLYDLLVLIQLVNDFITMLFYDVLDDACVAFYQLLDEKVIIVKNIHFFPFMDQGQILLIILSYFFVEAQYLSFRFHTHQFRYFLQLIFGGKLRIVVSKMSKTICLLKVLGAYSSITFFLLRFSQFRFTQYIPMHFGLLQFIDVGNLDGMKSIWLQKLIFFTVSLQQILMFLVNRVIINIQFQF